MSSYPNDQGQASGAIPVYNAVNAAAQLVPTPPTPPPATLAASGTWVSGVMSLAGVNAFAVAATLSQAGTLVVQRYIDPAGTIAIGAAISQVMTANTPAYVWASTFVAAS